MSPALLCKSSIQSGNAEQCALAFIHLLSSSCTSYFYNISYVFVLFVNASVWQYCQQHSECILSDPGPIILIISIISILLVVQLIPLYFIMQSMSNLCILNSTLIMLYTISRSIMTGRPITCNHCI